MNATAIIQARMQSSRLRAKSLTPISGKALLERVIDSVVNMKFITDIIVATTTEASDDPIEAFCNNKRIKCYRGDSFDVLNRFTEAIKDYNENECIVRITADNCLYDKNISLSAFNIFKNDNIEYLYVSGLSHIVPEFLTAKVIRTMNMSNLSNFDREHVTPFLRKNKSIFKVKELPPDFMGLRADLDKYLTVDTFDDLLFVEKVINKLNGEFNLTDLYSAVDSLVSGYNSYHQQLKIEKRENLCGYQVGDGCSTFIVAEIGQNHNGNLLIAKKLIDMAAKCGANAVKFQKRDIPSDLSEEAYNKPYDNPHSFGKTYGEHREYLELSEEDHLELKEYSLSKGLLYFCTPTDIKSVELMERIDNPIYKVASRDLINIPLLKKIKNTGKPVILSTGMSDLNDIEYALNIFKNYSAPIFLLQCLSQYPAPLEKTNLNVMHTLREKFSLLVGYSDHTTGIIACITASIMGACIVEKHITLSRAMKGTDHAGALEEEGLRRLVKYIREAEICKGNGVKDFLEEASIAKQKLGRSITSKIEILPGTKITEEMLELKSPGNGLSWKEKNVVIGKRAKILIKKDSILNKCDFE